MVVLLVIETYFFNAWLNITPHLYFIRRTAASIGLGTVIFGPALFFRRQGIKHLYLGFVSTLLAVLLISQFIYYKYSGGFLEFSSIFYANQVSELGETIKSILTPKLILFITPIVAIVISYFFSRQRVKQSYFFTKKESIYASILALLLICLSYGTLLSLEKKDWGDTSRLYSKVYDLGTLVGKIGIVNFYIEDAIKFISQSHQASAAQQDYIKNWYATKAEPVSLKDTGIAKGRNLIVIQVESLENWPIGATVNGQEITPNLNKLSSEGTYFDNYYSQIAEGNTADAEFSTMDSLYPLPDSVVFINHANNQMNALPGLLKNNGYDTAVLHGDVETFWNRSNVYPGMGYSKIFSQADYTVTRPVGFDGLGDADFFEQNVSKLQSLQQPFMSTLITLSSHTPFKIPVDLQTLDVKENDIAHTNPKTSDTGDIKLNATQADYVQSVNYADAAIGNFIEKLKTSGLYDNSLFVIYGDHNAFIGTADSAANHVPMILIAPGLNITGLNSEPASHLDLYPTLANLLGVPAPQIVIGQDLFNAVEPVATQRNIITGTIKFIDSIDKKYISSSDGEFQNGVCQTVPEESILPVGDCQLLYNQEQEKIKVSDIIVKYNQIKLLSNQ
ncbi:MAG: hypothetical protein JWO40_351 [Candidatus Doudnabacteria bacterium]|nr:hypothetical protein [Candidatus Doudnabacteria bacterium]